MKIPATTEFTSFEEFLVTFFPGRQVINKTVEIAIEKGIIKSKSIIVDATHTKARYNQKSPKEILMDRSRKLRKSVYEIDGHMKEKFPSKTTTNVLYKFRIIKCRSIM